MGQKQQVSLTLERVGNDKAYEGRGKGWQETNNKVKEKEEAEEQGGVHKGLIGHKPQGNDRDTLSSFPNIRHFHRF